MKRPRLFLFLALITIATLALAGCSAAATPQASTNKGFAADGSGAARESLGTAPSVAPGAPGAPVPAATPAPVGTVVAGNTTSATSERMIIKTGVFTMVVKDVQESLSAITALAEASGGYVMSSKSGKSGDRLYATIVIKVPVTTYEGSMDSLRRMAVEPPTESSTGQDVTEEFADVDAQVRNYQASEKQLLNLMDRAQTVDEILKIQAQLTTIRGQIERLQGRMQLLSRSAAMSTITVNLTPFVDEPVVKTGTDAWQPNETLKAAARAMVSVAQSLGDIVIWLAVFSPICLIPLVILWIVWKLFRRITRRK
jgi:hypothetical protein